MLVVSEESRYDRQERIRWWDQAALARGRVLVVGAGALGNEVVKNLVLVGAGDVTVADMDRIESSNLARCVFFRGEDVGRNKAEALAERAAELSPDSRVSARTVAVQRLGLGSLRAYDLIVGAVDNREARLWVGQACRKLGMPWVDGAIEGLQGVARVFGVEGACYECTLGEVDRQQLSHRRSCALLSSAEIDQGRTPTNATTASVVAGVQSQEAIKLLVGGVETLAGRAWVVSGETMLSYLIDYVEDDQCLSHDRYEEWLDDQIAGAHTTLRQLVSAAGKGLPFDAVDLEDDLVTLTPCSRCGGEERTAFRSALGRGDGECPRCGGPLAATSRASLAPDDPLLDVEWMQFSPPASDVVTLRRADKRRHVVLNVDGVVA